MLFSSFGQSLNYTDLLQLDGAFAAAHINYGESPEFNGVRGEKIAFNSGKGSLSAAEHVDDVVACLRSFDGTGTDFKKADREAIWKSYWLEYINAFDKLAASLPKSIATAYVGRQSIEIGFKYLLLIKNETFHKTHDLGELSKEFFVSYSISEQYLEGIESFCENYCSCVEGGYSEFFRFPEYKGSSYFAGNQIDISWLTYNFALILLKLMHFSGLDKEFVEPMKASIAANDNGLLGLNDDSLQ